MTPTDIADRPSLEALVENGLLPLESLHPGGLDTTRRLAAACGIGAGSAVLDVACGTGETACLLAGELGARVVGVDRAEEMLRRARAKAAAKGLDVTFTDADATALPFDDAGFDAVICECTLCFLDKPRAVGEMTRVVRSGGRVGMHDLCWKQGATHAQRRTLAEIEGERPETLGGWQRLFREAGLTRIEAVDLSGLMPGWMRESRRRLGVVGQLRLVLRIRRHWGWRGVITILRSEAIFRSGRLGYALVTGTKP